MKPIQICISLLNSAFNNFPFSSDTNIFSEENVKTYFRECNSIEAPFNDADHPVFVDSKYYNNDSDFIKQKQSPRSVL